MLAGARRNELSFKILKRLMADASPHFQKQVYEIIDRFERSRTCTRLEAVVLKHSLGIEK